MLFFFNPFLVSKNNKKREERKDDSLGLGHENVVLISTGNVKGDLLVGDRPGQVVGDEAGRVDLEGVDLDGVVVQEGVELLLELGAQLLFFLFQRVFGCGQTGLHKKQRTRKIG